MSDFPVNPRHAALIAVADDYAMDQAALSRNQAAASIRASADAVIEARTRQAIGWDTGAWASNVRVVDRQEWNTIEALIALEVADAFVLAPLAV